jgi:HAE1 family hydrophobic/amphiphilic exporter-1
MIAETFINRPVTAIVVSIVIALLGGICVLTLPVNQYPKITPPAVSVSANYTGADAITVEQTVATPVEEAINGVKGMEYIQSNSRSEPMLILQHSMSRTGLALPSPSCPRQSAGSGLP